MKDKPKSANPFVRYAIMQAHSLLSGQLGRAPTRAEIAAEIGAPIDSVRRAYKMHGSGLPAPTTLPGVDQAEFADKIRRARKPRLGMDKEGDR